jgi:GNAT superfamily N-acetyltransferase
MTMPVFVVPPIKLRPAMKGMVYENQFVTWYTDFDGEPNHLVKHEELKMVEPPVVSLTFGADRRILTYAPFEKMSVESLAAITRNHFAGAQDDYVELVQGFKSVWFGLWQDMPSAMTASENPPLAGADEIEAEVIDLIGRAFRGNVSALPPHLKIEDVGRLYVFITRDYKVRNRPALFLGGLYVDKQYRGRGHGKLMMAVLVGIADKLGLRMYLDAHPYEIDQSRKTGLPKDRLKEFYRFFGFRDAAQEARDRSGYLDLMVRNPK